MKEAEQSEREIHQREAINRALNKSRQASIDSQQRRNNFLRSQAEDKLLECPEEVAALKRQLAAQDSENKLAQDKLNIQLRATKRDQNEQLSSQISAREVLIAESKDKLHESQLKSDWLEKTKDSAEERVRQVSELKLQAERAQPQLVGNTNVEERLIAAHIAELMTFMSAGI